MSVHKHSWQPRSDIGMAMYSCECGSIGERVRTKVVARPYERERPEQTVGFKDQPRLKDTDGSTNTVRPRKVHRSPLPDLGVGLGRAFEPSPTYRKVCVAMLELGADKPLQTLAEMAGCSVAFVRKVQAHVMADDFAESA